MQRAIVHLDADAFFASVEQAADPRLRGKAIAVGGEKRGIIASASYEARKFGIYTPMPSVMARRLCPKLILLPGDFEKYELFSRLMFSYAYDFTPDVEIGSIDEGYFDLTGTRKPAAGIAKTIRTAIRQSLKLSVSEGVGANKLVSQIASKLKKPFGFECVAPAHEAEFLSPLANQWLPGIGPKTALQLNAAGLARIGQIAQTPVDLLGLVVGNQALQLRNFSRGIDERPVIPVRAPAKSYGEQETFAADTTDEEFLEATLRRMADKLMAKVREDGKSIRTITVKVRYNDMDEEQASESLAEPTDLETDIYSHISALLRKAWRRRVSLRLVSLKLSNVYEGIFRAGLALDAAARQHAAQERLAVTVDELRRKFGRTILQRGHDFTLRAKNGRGHEPENGGARLPPSPDLAGARQRASPQNRGAEKSGLGRSLAPPKPAPHNLAIVQRQRIGNSFARVTVSPGPELRFRIISNAECGVRNAECKDPKTDSSSPSQPSKPFLNSALRTPHSALAYVPLNVHSYYSFLDSTLSTRAVVDLAKRHELPAIALTDKNSLHGAVEFAQLAAAAGIKPIIAAEVEWNDRRVCLYAQNQEGYTNLCRILNQVPGSGGGAMSPHDEGAAEAIGNFKFEISNFKSLLRGPPHALQHNRAMFLPLPSRRGEGRGEGSSQVAYPADLSLSPKSLCSKSRSSASSKSAGPHSLGEFSLELFDTNGLLAVSPHLELARFFPDRFYFEIKNRATWEKRPSALPCVVSYPFHYELPADRWKYDVVQSIRTLTLLRQQHPEKRLDGRYHFRTPAEMGKLFAAHPELRAHSLEIAERCSFTISPGKPQFPAYRPKDGSTAAAFLRQLVMEGLRRRYPKSHVRLRPQLEEELAIITEVGYEEYFLIMWDLLLECRQRGIDWITRGSAADSLACYCLEISGVCPIRFDLYFRRFLNKERMALNKLPDIDVDFPHDRKDDVIDLIFEKYGPHRQAAVVGGFSTFQSRSAFAEVAKVLGVSEFQVRRLTERLPHFSRASELSEVVADTLECRDLPLDQEPYSTALRLGQFLDGFPRYPKMHPCGVVLSRQRMDEITPCFRSAKGYPTTHFDMDSVEAVGLIKMDILAQGGLAVMRDVVEMRSAECGVRSNETAERVGDAESTVRSGESLSNLCTPHTALSHQHFRIPHSAFCTPHSAVPHSPECSPIDADPPQPVLGCLDSPFHTPHSALRTQSPLRTPHSALRIPSPAGPFEDPQVWDLIAKGGARAVHHIESPAMISLCKMCNVRDIDTLIAIVSVIRPGAANESKKMEFARRYQGLSPVHYPHPSLVPCLRSTYGLVVYEEHILQMCEAFAGLPPGRADILRRALAKEKTELVDQIQVEFAQCARNLGRTEAEIVEVWDLVTGFRGYAFCKAHSTAYGVEAYQSAWIKLHYPAEFMAAVLTNGKGFYNPLVYILECHRLGIPLLPPSINEPGPQFTVSEQPRHGRAIRVPVMLVKGLTSRTKEAILRERTRGEFASLTDFLRRVQPLPEEMEALIRVGAFDIFGQPRTTQYWSWRAGRSAEGGMRSGESKGTKVGARGEAGTEISNPKSQISNSGSQISNSGSQIPGSGSQISNFKFQIANSQQLWLLPPGDLERLPAVPLVEPGRLERLRAEEELIGYPVSGHPLDLFPNIAWETYCPVNRLGEHIGEQIVTCGLVIEQRLFHQVTGEPMKFLTIADWTGIIETELFARTYQSYGLNTIRYRVLEITATVEPFENNRGHTLRVLRAGKPREGR